MQKLSPLEKETLFLYNKHNKNTKYPLEVEKIEFPLYITKILNKTKKRTPLENKKITTFRKKILYDLHLKSWYLQCIDEKNREIKRLERQQKLARTKDIKYENDPTKIKHFGIWFDTNSNIKLNRDTYAQKDKKAKSNAQSRRISQAFKFFKKCFPTILKKAKLNAKSFLRAS